MEEATWELPCGLTATLYAEDVDYVASNSGRTALRLSSTDDVPQAWLDVLRGILTERWPDGFVPHRSGDMLFDHYPQGLQDLCSQRTNALRQEATRTYGLLRWRFGIWQGSGQFSNAAFYWSEDGAQWFPLRLPWRITLVGHGVGGLDLTDAVPEALEPLSLQGSEEPLGWDMWHAAYALHDNDERTALILAVSAVEVEVKRLLGHLVPDADWLVRNLPSPPVHKILGQYLSTLPGIDSSLLPPKHVRAAYQKAVELRNELVHTGGRAGGRWHQTLDSFDLDRLLDAAADLLWLFDVYRGHSWGLEHLSNETRKALDLPLVSES